MEKDPNLLWRLQLMLEKIKDARESEAHLDSKVVLRPINEEFFGESLSSRSKKRLENYQLRLKTPRGIRSRGFDAPMLEALMKYAKDPSLVQDVVSYLNDLKDPQGYEFSRNLKLYSATSDAFIKFQEKDYTSFRWNVNYQKALKQVKEAFADFNLKVLHYKSDEDMVGYLPKTDTHSGFLSILTGKVKKGDNMVGMYDRYTKEVKRALKKGSFNKPILVANRTQASGEFTDEGEKTNTCKHKTRVVSMIDLIQIFAELQFYKPFERAFADWSEYAGFKDLDDQMLWLTRKAQLPGMEQFMSIDYSSFDQTISSWLIEDAFSVVRYAFKKNLSRSDQRLFDIVVHDFIHKDFILADGYVHSDKGVPSGSMFTQVIDSIVNVIVIKTYFNSLNLKCSTFVMGDDNVVFCPNGVTLEDLASYVMKNFGLIIKVDSKTNCGSLSFKEKKEIGFLSRYWRWWTGDWIWKSPQQIISRLLYPERFRVYSKDVSPEDVLWSYRDSFRQGFDQFIDLRKLRLAHPRDKERIALVRSRHMESGYASYRDNYLRRGDYFQ